MAVILEFANVILRKRAVDDALPGGTNALVGFGIPNISEDDHLLRVGFMATAEAERLIEMVVDRGFPTERLRENVSIIQWSVLPYPGWLEVGVVDNLPACWLAGIPPGRVASHVHSAVVSFTGPNSVDILAALRESCVLRSVPRPGAEAFVAERGDACIELAVIARDDGLLVVLIDRVIARRPLWTVDAQLFEDVTARLIARGGHVEWPRPNEPA